METSIGHSNWRTDPTDLLAELYSRILTANRELNSLISEYAEYFIQTSKAIINTYNLSTEVKISLIDFTEKNGKISKQGIPANRPETDSIGKRFENNNVKNRDHKKIADAHIVSEEGWFIIALQAS